MMIPAGGYIINIIVFPNVESDGNLVGMYVGRRSIGNDRVILAPFVSRTSWVTKQRVRCDEKFGTQLPVAK